MSKYGFTIKGFWAFALVGALVLIGMCLGAQNWLGAIGALALTVGIVVAHRDGGSR